MHRGDIAEIRRRVAVVLTVLLTVALVPPMSAQADDGTGRPAVQHAGKPVKGHALKAKPRRPDPATRRQEPPKATWPKAASAIVTLAGTKAAAAGAAKSSTAVRAGSLPVWVSAPSTTIKGQVQPVPGRVRVSVLDRQAAQRAGVDGLLHPGPY